MQADEHASPDRWKPAKQHAQQGSIMQLPHALSCWLAMLLDVCLVSCPCFVHVGGNELEQLCGLNEQRVRRAC